MDWTTPIRPRRRHPGRPWPGTRGGPWPLSGLIVITIATVCPAAAAQTAAPGGYAVTILSTLSPNPALSSVSNGAGVNDRGWIVGDANYPGAWTGGGTSYPPNTTEHATLWRGGQITDLATLGGPNSSIGFVARPSNTGLISGNAQNEQADPDGENWGVNFSCTATGAPCEGVQYEARGFAWKDGVIRPLPTLGGDNALAFGGANDAGQIVGMAETAHPDPTCQQSQFFDSTTGQQITLNQVLDWRPVVWGPGYGEPHQLPLFPGDRVGTASAINDQGQVVGGSGICLAPSFGAVEHALLWQNGRMINLGSLGGTYDNLATAINDRGQVVGWSDLPGDTPSSGTTHSFLWQNGVMTDLGTLPGDTSTFAFGINNAGQVVGQSCDQNGNCHAFLWQNGTMTDLNTIAHLTTPGSFELAQAEGINSQGQIVGQAIDNNTGNTLGFAAVPCGSSQAADASCNNGGQNAITATRAKAARPDIGPRSLDRRMEFASLLGLP